MTTIRTLIEDALREGGILALGESASADMATEGLRRINVLFRSLLGNELGDNLVNMSYGSNGLSNTFAVADNRDSFVDSTYVPANTNLLVNLATAKTLYLDPNPKDGARFAVVDVSGNFNTIPLTINGNGRTIEGATTVTMTAAGETREWFFRADLGEWVKVMDLALGDASPFPLQFDDFLTTSLALRLNPRYGQTIGQETMAVLTRARSQFRSKYRQETVTYSELGLTKLPSLKRYFAWGIPAYRFYRGY